MLKDLVATIVVLAVTVVDVIIPCRIMVSDDIDVACRVIVPEGLGVRCRLIVPDGMGVADAVLRTCSVVLAPINLAETQTKCHGNDGFLQMDLKKLL